jgi:hypothetical protein
MPHATSRIQTCSRGLAPCSRQARSSAARHTQPARGPLTPAPPPPVDIQPCFLETTSRNDSARRALPGPRFSFRVGRGSVPSTSSRCSPCGVSRSYVIKGCSLVAGFLCDAGHECGSGADDARIAVSGWKGRDVDGACSVLSGLGGEAEEPVEAARKLPFECDERGPPRWQPPDCH